MLVTLRMALLSELPAIEAIIRDAYTPYISRIGRKPGPMLDDYSALIRDGRIHVADVDGRALGLVVIIPQADAMLLDNVAVSPDSQGVGVGRRILEFVEQTAIDAGFGFVKLYTNEAMSENIALYTRRGYEETHRTEESGLRRVYMRKALGTARNPA